LVEDKPDTAVITVEKSNKNSLTRAAEVKLRGQHRFVIGVDEAGRGPLAGPVVAAACYVADGVLLDGIMDSKKLTSEAVRETTYDMLVSHPAVHWGVCVVDHTEVDRINILQASLQAMRRATEDLLGKAPGNLTAAFPVVAETVALVDGNRVPVDMPVAAEFVIKGDGHIFSIAAASVIAKVTRDRIMHQLDRQYPEYGFAQHKGYGTQLHMQRLWEYGPSAVHRLTYAPVAKAVRA
jgi:ribonuclease HII